METLDKEMMHVPGRMEWAIARFYPVTQNIMQFKTHELFISGIFCLIISGHCWLRVTETAKNEAAEKGALLYLKSGQLWKTP